MKTDYKFWLAAAAALYFFGESLRLRGIMYEAIPFTLKGAELHGCPITPEMRAMAARIEQESNAKYGDPAQWGHRNLFI